MTSHNEQDREYKYGLRYLLARLPIEWKSVLEVGVAGGMSTNLILGMLAPNGKLYSVDIEDHSTVASDNRWTFILGDSAKVGLPEGPHDLIYLDSSHEEGATYAELVRLVPLLKENGIMLLDDVGIEEMNTDRGMNFRFGVWKAVVKYIVEEKRKKIRLWFCFDPSIHGWGIITKRPLLNIFQGENTSYMHLV